MKSLRRSGHFCLALGVLGSLGSVALAGASSWHTNSSGIFSDPANWNNGVPGSSDQAVFNRGAGAGYTVSFLGTPPGFPAPVYTTDQLIVRSNDVTFARGALINAPSYVADHNSVDPSDRAIVVGQQTGDVAKLTTTIPISAEAATIADAAGSVAAVEVASGKWTLSAGGGSVEPLIVGNRGFATLSIFNGAIIHLTAIEESTVIGNQTGSTGGVLVSGAGSAILADVTELGPDQQLVVGGAGTGTLTITAGGHVTDSSAFVASESGSTGDVSVDGNDSLWLSVRKLVIGVDPLGQNRHSQGTLTVLNGGTVQSYSQITITPSGTIRGNGNVTAANFQDNKIGSLQNDGLISPGFPLGRLVMAGDLTQSASGHLQIQIGGRTPLTQYDRLFVNGKVHLDGALDVSFSNFAPAAGESFDVLDWKTLDGTFASVNLPPLSGGLTWDLSHLYSTGELKVGTIFLPADFDENGTVAAADLAKWKAGFGTASDALHMQGDANGDGRVDGTDLLIWQRQLGSSAPVVAANFPVPEHATWLLLIVAAGSMRRKGGKMHQELVSD